MCAYDESWAVGHADKTRRSSVSPGVGRSTVVDPLKDESESLGQSDTPDIRPVAPELDFRHTERAQSQVFERTNGIGRVTVSLMVDVEPVADPDHARAVLVDIDAGAAHHLAGTVENGVLEPLTGIEAR